MAKAAATNKGKNVVPMNKGKQELATEADMLKMMEQDAGKGVSTAMEDNVVPLVYILQALSPQVVKNDPKYVKGATPGSIWFRGTKTVIDGDEGILVQPVFFSKCVIEWRPDRGGFVSRHNVDDPKDIPGARQIKNPKDPSKTKWISKDDNDLVSTREHVVLVHDVLDKPTPFVIPMSGSQHSSSRNWMGLMNSKQVPGTDKTAPSFAYLYRMKIEARTDGKNNWFGWAIEDAGGEDGGEPMLVQDVAAYKLARKIEGDFMKGVMRAEVADAPDEGGDGTAGGEI